MGPASLPETWSGVPYCLLLELKRRNIKVFEIDLEPHSYIKWLYNRIIMPFVSIFVSKGELSIYRSVFFRIYRYVVLKKRLRMYCSADIILGVSSFNISVPKTSKPVILFSDWPLSYDFYKKGIDVGLYQKHYIALEERYMRNADLIISLFPTCAKYINSRLNIKKALALGVNVVNNLSLPPRPDIVQIKKRNNKLVFIGRHHYLSGAIELLDAYNKLVEVIPNLELDVVGLRANDFPNAIVNKLKGEVRFWGYLDKGNVEQCKTYYDILNNASLYVNTTPGWVGYTSMIEAMYFYTPVVVYPCVEFIDEFGEQLDFGVYMDSSKELFEVIQLLLNENEYYQIAHNAHKRVQDYTWPHFTDKLLATIENIQWR